MASPEPAVARVSRNESYAALTWQHLVNDAMVNYLPVVLPAFAAARGIPLFLLGALITAQSFGQVLQPLSGVLADRVGGRSFTVLGPVLSGLAAVGVAFFTSYDLIAACVFLGGIGSTLFHPQTLATARSLTARRRGVSMSVFLVGGELGRALVPLASSALVVWGGIHGLALLVFLPLLGLPWLLRAVPKAPPAPRSVAPLNLRKHMRPAAVLLSFTTFRGAAMLGVVFLMPEIWHAEGGSLVGGASLLTTFYGIGMFGNISGGLLADRFGGQYVLYGTTGVSTLAAAGLFFAHGIWLFPLLAVIGFAIFSSPPITMLVGQDIFPENRALGSGLALGAGIALGALLVLAVSYVAAHFAIIDGLFVVLAFLLLATASVPFLFAHQQHAQPAPAVGPGA